MVRRILSLWPGSWPLVKPLLVLVVAEIYAMMVCSAPLYAFQINSATGYARVVSQAAQQAYIASHRAQVISSLAPAISAAGAGSVAIRAVAGPIGWASLAVTAGLIIAGMLYDSGEIKQVKDNAATAAGVPSVVSINGQTYPGTLAGCTPTPTIGCVQVLTQPNGLTFNQCTAIPTPVSPNPPTGWTAVIVEWNGATGGCFNNARMRVR